MEELGDHISSMSADALWRLVCAFRQRAPAPRVVELARALTDDGILGGRSQQALLDACLPPSAAAALPPDTAYQQRVLRAVVLAAEQDGQEVCEELMQLYSCCLMGRPQGSKGSDSCSLDASGGGRMLSGAPPPQPGWCYKLYAYAPAGEAAAETMQRLTALQQQAVEGRCSSAEPQHQEQQHAWQEQQDEQPPVADSLSPPAAPAASACPATAAAGDGRHGLLALHVSLNLSEGGTGCHEWEAGFFLAEWVLNLPELVAGRCCLEIGCGAGMVGVALHRCGTRRAILTDGNPEAVANCRFNLRLNGLPLLPPAEAGSDGMQTQQTQQGLQRWVETRQLCWEDGWPGSSTGSGGSCANQQQKQQQQQQRQQQQQQQPTVVLGADLLYDPTVIPVLLELLKQVLLAAREEAAQAAAAETAAVEQTAHAAAMAAAEAVQGQQPAVYLATTLRNEATLQQFLAAAAADPALCIQQLAPDPAAAAAAATATEVVPVCFQHLPELAAARGRIYLHRLTLAA